MYLLPPPEKPELLLSFDFDGTLHFPDHSPDVVDPAIFGWLRRLREERGTLWVINTGRSLMHALEGLQDGGFPFLPDFIVGSEREIYRVNSVGRYAAFGDWNARSEKVHKKLFKKAGRHLKRMRKFIEEETRAEYVSVASDPAGVIASSEEEMVEICEYIATWRDEIPELAYERNSIYLRFSHRDFNKGTSLAHIAEHLGLGVEKRFAIGDGPNDLGMLKPEVAGRLAAPANAAPEVREVLSQCGGFLATEEASRGTLQALEHFFPEQGEPEEPAVVRLKVE